MNDDLKEFADILFAPRERDELKQRIEKAIVYIEHAHFMNINYKDGLLKILKGSDKE